MPTEADTCRKFVVPLLQRAGWDDLPHAINEQRTFTDGRVLFVGGKAKRGRQKRADYTFSVIGPTTRSPSSRRAGT
jgi:type I restriction enzyme R subunit